MKQFLVFLFAAGYANLSFAQSEIIKGELDFLRSNYGVQSKCTPRDDQLNSKRVLRATLGSECTWSAYAKIPADQAIAEYGQRPGEETYQVFYRCPAIGANSFPTINKSGLLWTRPIDGSLRFSDRVEGYEESFSDFFRDSNTFSICNPLADTTEGSSTLLPLSEPEAAVRPGNLYVTTQSVNFRAGPGNSHAVLGQLKSGGVISSLGVEFGWHRFRRNGRDVYVYKSFVRKAN